MSAHIKTLRELNDEIVYPQTVNDAVFDKDGIPLSLNLTNIHNKIDGMMSSFEIVLDADDWIEINNSDIPTYDDYIYGCRVNVSEMSASYNPKLFTNYISTTQAGKLKEDRAVGLIKDILTFDGYIVAYSYQKPDVNVKIRLSL